MKPIDFEVATYVMYFLTVMLIAIKYRGHRDYWYALIGCTLLFPFEWFADKFWMFLDYSHGFVMMFDRLPLMMPFAYGWFFALPLIFCLRLKDRIDALPPFARVLILFVIFILWDFVVEFSSTSFHLWDYHWRKELKIGGVITWWIPIAVSTANTSLYFVHGAAKQKARGKGWIQGFSIHVAAYYLLFSVQAVIGWGIIRALGIGPYFGG